MKEVNRHVQEDDQKVQSDSDKEDMAPSGGGNFFASSFALLSVKKIKNL